MKSDYLFLAFSLAVGVVTLVARIREVKKYNSIAKKCITETQFEKRDFSKQIKLVFLFLILICIGGAIYGVIIKNIVVVSACALFTLVFLGESVKMISNYTYMFNDSSIVYKDKKIDYKSINNIDYNTKIKISYANIVLYSGISIKVPSEIAPSIINLLEKYRRNKKEMKEIKKRRI